ncbi:MAG: ABC transporter substrate-binding protein [Akkermansiaceae bacterium]
MNGNWKKYLGVLLPMALVVAAPIVLRDDDAVAMSAAKLRLEVITPHNELIRREFGEAFSGWYEEKHGESVFVNWRTPGGTSEIKRVLNGAFASAEKTGSEGIGIDVFFGGGVYDFSGQAKQGHFQKLDLFDKQPEIFGNEIVPALQSGETYYSDNRDWIGTCLSSFGICYNIDSLSRLKLDPPLTWDDLGKPGFRQGIALADPTKSGSVAKAFEMLVQQKIHEKERAGMSREEASKAGWAEGLNLIQRIGANARYFADGASKVPHDVAQGNAIAGMCIDFYGRSYNESLRKDDGRSRLVFVSPRGGTSYSVDPVAVLKGAPNQKVAQEFVNFILSKEGQMLWNARPGTTMGPKIRGLRRLPVRKDLYQEPYLADMVDAKVMPYEVASEFIYEYELTGRHFSPLRAIIRAMCIDSHQEMKSAWNALIEADFPEEATAKFYDISPVGYEVTLSEIKKIQKSKDKVAMVRLMNRLGKHFRESYQAAEELAGKGGGK